MDNRSYGWTRILPVSYFVQPTSNTCQSTCLKMMAYYLEQFVLLQSRGGAALDILNIYKDINESPDRPDKIRDKHNHYVLNTHTNIKWWLQRRFPSLHFYYDHYTDESIAGRKIVQYINSGMPVLMSVSHANVEGHIVLVVGYENYIPVVSSADFHVVVHDPNGKFDPTLLSTLYGKRNNLEGGMSLLEGGQFGPGRNCRLPISSVGRQRRGDEQLGTYYLTSARF